MLINLYFRSLFLNCSDSHLHILHKCQTFSPPSTSAGSPLHHYYSRNTDDTSSSHCNKMINTELGQLESHPNKSTPVLSHASVRAPHRPQLLHPPQSDRQSWQVWEEQEGWTWGINYTYRCSKLVGWCQRSSDLCLCEIFYFCLGN